MTDKNADELIERLKNACTFHRFDEPGVYAEYTRVFARYDYDRMNEAIDLAIEEDSRNVPAISVLIKHYRAIKEKSKDSALIKNDKYCPVCDDKGFVLITKILKSGDQELPYDFILHCPFCAVGRTYVYDGSKCKEHKSVYWIPPLTQHFSDELIQEMREENLKKHANQTDTAEYVNGKLQNVGKNIPGGWQYDMPYEEA